MKPILAGGRDVDVTEVPLRRRRRGFAALTLGAVGVVFGDIATSPLYALREALAHSRPVGPVHIAVLGVVSLILWTLTLIVTVKYIAFLMRADNKGEGGPVAMMALAQRALGRPSGALFLLGIVGVSLFYGDGVITPAFSVLSAVEGLKGRRTWGISSGRMSWRSRRGSWSPCFWSRPRAPRAWRPSSVR